MKGDFSRNTYDSMNHFMRVLMQQGRVQLDADWNEQVSILLHFLQSLATDIIGQHGGPENNCGFEISTNGTHDFQIGTGNYYVNGILCKNEIPTSYQEQYDYPLLETTIPEGVNLVYLDVWEHYLTYIQEPHIREVALGGPDTASRSKIVWQVKTTNEKPSDVVEINKSNVETKWDGWIKIWQPTNRGNLKARARVSPKNNIDPCIIPPDAQYRGPENQLYRIEIHTGGQAGTAKFKWSRDNGSIIFPIRKIDGNMVTLDHLGKDESHTLKAGQWVEVTDDHIVLQGETAPLLQIESVKPSDNIVILRTNGTTLPAYTEDDPKNPLLRLWGSEPIVITESEAEDVNWIDLEDGIKIQFQGAGNEHTYRTGDYWLIPARTETRDIEWPLEDDGVTPKSLEPHGVEHYYAPLWVITVTNGAVNVGTPQDNDCRRKFKDICFITEGL